MKQKLHVKEEIEKQLKEAQEAIEDIQAQKKVMQKELETAGDYLLDQEEKTNIANNTALDLLNQLKEADEEIAGLKI